MFPNSREKKCDVTSMIAKFLDLKTLSRQRRPLSNDGKVWARNALFKKGE